MKGLGGFIVGVEDLHQQSQVFVCGCSLAASRRVRVVSVTAASATI